MRICFFADSESIHTIRWCKHFQMLGHDVHVISLNEALIEGIKVYPLGVSGIRRSGGNWRTLLWFRKVKKLPKQIQPDTFHALYATSYGITGALCGFHPYVITALGSDVLISPKRSKLYRALLAFAFKRTDIITIVAAHMESSLLELGVTPEKIEVIPMGVDMQVFNATDKKLSDEKFVVVSTRNFEPVYNIPHLLNAISKVKDQIPTIHLNLLGAGSLKEELVSLTKALGIESYVDFIGKKTQPEMVDYLKNSHVFVSVSLSDGNNISLNEGMACGTFNIVTDIPANKQWIQDGENGFLIPVNDVDALAKKIVETYQNYQALVDKATPINQVLLEKNGIWQNNMRQMEVIYEQLTKKG